jgi:hypothetical protein
MLQQTERLPLDMIPLSFNTSGGDTRFAQPTNCGPRLRRDGNVIEAQAVHTWYDTHAKDVPGAWARERGLP